MQERVLAVLSSVSAAFLVFLTLVMTLNPQGHSPFLIGLAEPVLGLPHFLTFLGIGAWVGRLDQPGVWIVPSSFLVGMIPGFLFGVAQIPVLALDLMIRGLLLASVVPLVAAILMPVRLTTRDAATTMMVFGGLHGHLLGAGTAPNSIVGVGLGAITSTIVLLAMGASVGFALSHLK